MTFNIGVGSIVGLFLAFLAGGFALLPPLPQAFFELREAASRFSVLGDIDALGGYSTTSAGVFYRGAPLPGADPATFTVIDAYYAKDATHVYFNLEPISATSTAEVLPGADPRTLSACASTEDKDDCVRDAQRVYMDGMVVAGADPATFVPLTSSYAKDASHVYYEGVVMPSADIASFVTVIGSTTYDAQDKNAKYLNGVRL
jgi:hypothetical protein